MMITCRTNLEIGKDTKTTTGWNLNIFEGFCPITILCFLQLSRWCSTGTILMKGKGHCFSLPSWRRQMKPLLTPAHIFSVPAKHLMRSNWHRKLKSWPTTRQRVVVVKLLSRQTWIISTTGSHLVRGWWNLQRPLKQKIFIAAQLTTSTITKKHLLKDWDSTSGKVSKNDLARYESILQQKFVGRALFLACLQSGNVTQESRPSWMDKCAQVLCLLYYKNVSPHQISRACFTL